jgi:hypothetical protein
MTFRIRTLDRYGDSGEGDVRALNGQRQGYFRSVSEITV